MAVRPEPNEVPDNEYLHKLREHADNPELYSGEESYAMINRRDIISSDDIEVAHKYMNAAMNKLKQVGAPSRDAELHDAMAKLIELHNSSEGRNTEQRLKIYRDQSAVRKELCDIIDAFIAATGYETFVTYDQLRTPDEKKAFIRANMGAHSELRDPYFMAELMRDFRADDDFASFLVDHIDAGIATPENLMMMMQMLIGKAPNAVEKLRNKSTFLKSFAEVMAIAPTLFKHQDVRFIHRLLTLHQKDSSGLSTVLKKIAQLPAERQGTFLDLLNNDEFSYNLLFKAKADCLLFAEIVSITSGSDDGLLYHATRGFDKLYEFGPDANGTADQIETAKAFSTKMLVSILATSGDMLILNCSHRELTAEVVKRNPREVREALDSLSEGMQGLFFKGMIERGRLGILLTAQGPERDFIIASSIKSLRHVIHEVVLLSGFQTIALDPNHGDAFMKAFYAELRANALSPDDPKNPNKKTQGNQMLRLVEARFSEQLARIGIRVDETEAHQMREKISEANRLETLEALRDGVFTVMTLFTTDPRNVSNTKKDLWMQNSDFFRTYKAFIGQGYKPDTPIASVKDADRLTEVTLRKTVNGTVIEQKLLKSLQPYLDMKASLANRKVDMIVQRGHCWDAEESFYGKIEARKSGVLPSEHPASHHKLILIGGCFQAGALKNFEKSVSGKTPYFVATSKTGKGEVTIPLTSSYAEAIVTAAQKSNGGVDMQKIDATIRSALRRTFENVPEADGYVLPSDAPQLVRRLFKIEEGGIDHFATS